MSDKLTEKLAVNIEPKWWLARLMSWSWVTVTISQEAIEIIISAKKKYSIPKNSIQSIEKEYLFSDFLRMNPIFEVKTASGSGPFLISSRPFSKLESGFKRFGYSVV